MISKNSYYAPIKKRDIIEIKNDSPAHKGNLKYSIDFNCKIDTPVHAAASGTIVWLRKNSRVGGPNKKYWFKGNRIVIKHKNKEFTAYEHLKYGGVLVRLGQKVKLGEVIGYSGNTGYSFVPHLHFEVFIVPVSDLSEGRTIRISLK